MSSNDFTQVRDYIKTRMRVVDPTAVEWLDSLTEIDNIPQTKLDTAFHITLGPSSSSPAIDQHIEDDATVTITIFKRGFNKTVEARDIVLQRANCIRLDMVNPRNFEDYKAANDGNIEDVVSVSIIPEEINTTNDNIIKVEIELNIRLFFGTT